MDVIEYVGCVKYDHIGIKIPSYYLVSLKMPSAPYYIRGPCKKGTDLTSLKVKIEKVISDNLTKHHAHRLIKFVNFAKPLTNKLHQLDALKITDKLKRIILEDRQNVGFFTDLTQFKSRIGVSLEKIFIKSLLKEIVEQETDVLRMYLSSNE